MSNQTVMIEHAPAPSFPVHRSPRTPSRADGLVNVYVIDPSSREKIIAAREITVDKAIEWAREYLAIDTEREIVIKPARKLSGAWTITRPADLLGI